MKTGPYTVQCQTCERLTSRKYAREHAGQCKACHDPENFKPRFTDNDTPTREQRIIDHGYQAYAREEGYYDTPDF
jgi:hypothetical protein